MHSSAVVLCLVPGNIKRLKKEARDIGDILKIHNNDDTRVHMPPHEHVATQHCYLVVGYSISFQVATEVLFCFCF